MKIIDFDHYGNVIRLYLGADDCEDYWGDDWNDAPYEHNAGRVYSEYRQGYVEFAFPLKYDVHEACDGYFNSPFSKEDMKNRKVPCLIISTEPEVDNIIFKDIYDIIKIEIYFGDNIDEISQQIKELGGHQFLG